MLGNQYVGLSPGGSDTLLANGGEIAYTQSAVVIERLIGKVFQSLGGGGGGGSSGSSGGSGGSGGEGEKPPAGGKGS